MHFYEVMTSILKILVSFSLTAEGFSKMSKQKRSKPRNPDINPTFFMCKS